MINSTLKVKFINFIRKEYFDPDISQALLVMLGLLVPLLVAHYLHVLAIGTFSAITGQILLTTNIQNTYPQKAIILFFGLVFISLTIFIATLVGPYYWLAILAMAVIAGLSSLAKEVGSYGLAIGICAVVVFLLALGPPNTLETAIDRFLAVWLGGLWAALLLLLPWFFRPDLPYYTKLAHSWELNGNLASFLATYSKKEASKNYIQNQEIALRNAINNVLPYLRKHHKRYFYIRRDLLKIVRASSRFGAALIALTPALENLRQNLYAKPENAFYIQTIQQLLTQATVAAKSIADTLIFGRDKDIAKLKINIEQFSLSLQKAINSQQENFSAELDLHRIFTLLQSAVHYLEDAHLLLTRIKSKKNLPLPAALSQKSSLNLRSFLKKIFQFRLTSWKHTLRISLITAFCVGIYLSLDIPRGYWIALTVMVVLQPDYGTTQQKAWQRTAGTLLGTILGTFLLLYPFSLEYTIIAIAICTFLFIYFQARNYIVSVMFLTILLVSMFEIAGAADWHIAIYRLLATAFGGLLAIAAALFLWPEWERTKVRVVLQKGVQANIHLLQQLEQELAAKSGFHARVIAARRKAETSNLEIADSVKRVQLEPGFKKPKLKILQSIAYQNSLLTRELISFAALLTTIPTDKTFQEEKAALHQYLDILQTISAAIISEQPLTSIPEVMPYVLNFSLADQLQISYYTNSQQSGAVNPELRTEIIHDQIIKIALVVQQLGKSVKLLNEV